MFIFSLQNKKIDVNDVELKTEWWFVFLAVGFLVILFKMFDKYSKNNNIKIEDKKNQLLEIDFIEP